MTTYKPGDRVLWGDGVVAVVAGPDRRGDYCVVDGDQYFLVHTDGLAPYVEPTPDVIVDIEEYDGGFVMAGSAVFGSGWGRMIARHEWNVTKGTSLRNDLTGGDQ
jgi:hypothetical protein